jgi:hypothetical protein
MQADSPTAVVILNPGEQADTIARIVAMEVAHRLQSFGDRLARLERAVAEIQDRQRWAALASDACNHPGGV